MQTTRVGIGLVRKFSPGMQPRENYLHRADFLSLVSIHRHPSAVICNRYRAILKQSDRNKMRITPNRLVDTVIDNLLNQVIWAVGLGIHSRAFTHGLETGKDFNCRGIVIFSHDKNRPVGERQGDDTRRTRRERMNRPRQRAAHWRQLRRYDRIPLVDVHPRSSRSRHRSLRMHHGQINALKGWGI